LGIIKEAIILSRSTDNVMGFYKGAELLGKHLGMFSDKDAGLTGADAVAAALRDVADKLNG
jgi:hypothetical protein